MRQRSSTSGEVTNIVVELANPTLLGAPIIRPRRNKTCCAACIELPGHLREAGRPVLASSSDNRPHNRTCFEYQKIRLYGWNSRSWQDHAGEIQWIAGGQLDLVR